MLSILYCMQCGSQKIDRNEWLDKEKVTYSLQFREINFYIYFSYGLYTYIDLKM